MVKVRKKALIFLISLYKHCVVIFNYFCPMKHLVIIGLVIPEPASTAAGNRMMQLMRLFEEWNYRITFLTAAKNMDYSEKIDFQEIKINDSSFDKLIKNLNPNIVLFDRYVTEEQFGWRVAENCPNAVRILDTEDLHFLREARKTAFSEKREIAENDYYNEIFKREISSVLRCDLSLIISEFEYELLTKKFKINPEILFYIPFLFEGTTFDSQCFESRKNFVSIGNFLHEPNWQTVLKLKKIWKNIRKRLPETEIHIYGAYPSEKVFQLHNKKDGFIIKGRADSVEKIFNEYKILLAPIPFGAGLKGKLFESMIFGIPNITTSIGAEAMHENGKWNGFTEDDDEKFIEKSVELYLDKSVWEESQKNGFLISQKLFAQIFFVEPLKNRIFEIEKNTEHHRNSNYLGKILQYQTLNSAKYMSKWIEEKNKNRFSDSEKLNRK